MWEPEEWQREHELDLGLPPVQANIFLYRLCCCTSVANSGANSINCPMSWVALYIMPNSFLCENLIKETYIRNVYTEMVQRSDFCEILSPEKSTGRDVFWHLRRRQQRS